MPPRDASGQVRLPTLVGPLLTRDCPLDCLRGGLLHVRQDIAIGVQRDPDPGMAAALADGLRVLDPTVPRGNVARSGSAHGGSECVAFCAFRVVASRVRANT